MQKLLQKISFGILTGFVLAGCTFVRPHSQSEPDFLSSLDHQMKTIYLDEKPLQVELVTTPSSRAQGLSGREEIGAEGMLFIFSDLEQRNFWMKDMQFAIDIVWIRQGVVVGISENVLPPVEGTSVTDLKLYPSPEAADMVLELPAGDAQGLQISVGSQLTVELNQQ